MKSMSVSDVLANNRKVVYSALRKEGSISRSELGRLTSLSAPTVFKIVDEFIERGLIIPGGGQSGNLGRKPLNLLFNPNAYCMAGVEMDGDRMRAALFNLVGDPLGSAALESPGGFTLETGRAITDAVMTLSEASGIELARVAALGIGFPGVVDTDRRRVEFAPLVGIGAPLDVSDVLADMDRRLGLTVRVENDANAAAYGELIRFGPETALSLLYLSLGTGLGGGLVLDGRLRRGPRHIAGEIGYFLGAPGESASIERKGALEGRINLDALRDRFGYEPGAAPAPDAMIEYLALELALPVANAVNLLDMDLLVLDGPVFLDICARFVPSLQRALSRMTLGAVRVQPAKSAMPCALGAAMLAFDGSMERFFGN